MYNLPDYLHGQASEILNRQSCESERRSLWAVILGVKPVRDGDMWCCLYGDNLQVGIAGFGTSPEQAMYAFEVEFQKIP